MSNSPKEIKLTNHAQMRLAERKDEEAKYNTKNLMKSNVKWYNKDDLIPDCALYRHCCYTTRKSNQMGYITDGDIEVIYNKNTKTAITILEVKEKFKPITQFIKPIILERIKIKKEQIKMKKNCVGNCPDCGKMDVEIIQSGMYKGLCKTCRQRKQNAKNRDKIYVPYIKLTPEEKEKIDQRRISHARKEPVEIEVEPIELKVPDNNSYYQSKANQAPIETKPMVAPIKTKESINSLSDQISFIQTLRNCGCEIPDESLNDVLSVLLSTDKLKDIFMTIAKNDSQQAMLDLEQALNVVERKLQHDWEFNGFQEEDDIRFKEFLTWRRTLKGAIFFWKKLYQTNTIIEMQRAWNAYTADPNDKILLAGDRIDSIMKRYQITTESISTILNTRRPFTRVFYATDKDSAYEMFKQWMADRNLHENKSKTTIVELTGEGSEDAREEKEKH